MRKYLLVFTLLFPFMLQADYTGDSLQYLTTKDTIFLELGPYQEKIFEHYIEPRQTLFSLAKFYGLRLEELYFHNPNLQENVISPGQMIRVPIPRKAIKRYRNPDFDRAKHIPVCYVIKKGDTMYNISKRVFEMPVDTIMIRNQLTDFTLSPGQVLQIGWMSLEGIPAHFRRNYTHPVWKRNQTLKYRYLRQKQTKTERLERGVAYWQKNTKSGNELYALHRYAPINSIIAVTNPMKNRTVYVKVIGKMPSSVYGDNVVVVLSSKAANMLGAKDARFFVKVKYLR